MPYKNKELEAAYKIKSRETRNARKRAFYSTPHGLELKRAWYQRHREEILEKRKAYRQAKPEEIAARKKAHYEANREMILDRCKQYVSKNKDKVRELQRKNYIANKQKRNATSKAYYESHKEHLSKWQREYEKANWSKVLARGREWKRRNPIKVLAYVNRRRARKHNATIGDAKEIQTHIVKLRTSPDTVCHYCAAPLFGMKMHIDHVTPLSRNGAHSVDNLVAACPKCNYDKGTKLVEEWKGVVN